MNNSQRKAMFAKKKPESYNDWKKRLDSIPNDYSNYTTPELKALKISIQKNPNWSLKQVQKGGSVYNSKIKIDRELSKR